jgi:hypothetical protein
MSGSNEITRRISPSGIPLDALVALMIGPLTQDRRRQTYVPPRPHRRKPKGLVGGPVPSSRGMRPKLTPATLRQIHRRIHP